MRVLYEQVEGKSRLLQMLERCFNYINGNSKVVTDGYFLSARDPWCSYGGMQGGARKLR